jgi:hypothetical protein
VLDQQADWREAIGFMDAVRRDTRYLVLADLENNRMAEQRELLAVMRESGEAPRRVELR